MLAEPDALLAARFAASSALTMPLQDALSIRAVVMVVMHVSVLGRILGRVRVVRRHFRHWTSPLLILINFLLSSLRDLTTQACNLPQDTPIHLFKRAGNVGERPFYDDGRLPLTFDSNRGGAAQLRMDITGNLLGGNNLHGTYFDNSRQTLSPPAMTFHFPSLILAFFRFDLRMGDGEDAPREINEPLERCLLRLRAWRAFASRGLGGPHVVTCSPIRFLYMRRFPTTPRMARTNRSPSPILRVLNRYACSSR
jgi:hypothetical protein